MLLKKAAALGLASLLLLAALTSLPAAGAPLQQFATTGAAEIDVAFCYDTNAANAPAQASGRLVCNAANPASLPANTTVRSWTIVNLPAGNRLASPVVFTPSAAGQWQPVAVPCAPFDANNACTAPGALAIGDVHARADFGCDNPNVDVIANGGSGQNISLWPDEAFWTPPAFDRVAASPALGGAGALTGGADAYMHAVVPFPATWTFGTLDRAVGTSVYLLGASQINIVPTRITRASYTSAYPGQSGLSVTASYLGDSPDQPPNDRHLCLDSPFDTIFEEPMFTPGSATRVVRWAALQSAFDLGDASLDRILDWQCDTVGSPADSDSDGDCDPDASDINDASRDSDGDLVPDGVERAYNSDPSLVDADGDGCADYCEIFQYTDPADADSDGDGQADMADAVSTNCVSPCTGDDAPATGSDAMQAADDNCPAVANPDQLNTDALFQFHGMGAGTMDATNPDEDPWGDACDPDDDNDGLPGATESAMRIRAWSGYTGTRTTVCAGPDESPTFPTHVPMSDVLGDVDFDYVLDGVECVLRSRPDVSVRGTVTASGTVLNCSAATLPAPPFDGGCAQPGVASHASGSDADGDGLYMPGASSTGYHAGIEARFRTRQITLAPGVSQHDADTDGLSGDADRDSDRDFLGPFVATTVALQDGVEARIYGTGAGSYDSDQDGCPDGDEVADLNGDGNSNSGDQGLLGSKIGVSPLDDSPADGQVDDYSTAMNADLNKDALVNSGDQGFLGAIISAPGSCQVAGAFAEGSVDIASAAKHLP